MLTANSCRVSHRFLQPRVISEKEASGAITRPWVPAAFAAKCWPELKLQRQPVELRFSVDEEDSTPAAAGEAMQQ
jgi:hypothetical protein